jgi:uncharacterized membrane protein YgcG
MALSIPIISEYDGKGISKAIKEFKQLETAGEKAQFAIKKAAIPAAAALAGLAAAAGPAISAASDLEENLSKVNVIFGEGAKEIENFAKTAATALGQSQNAVLEAAGTFGTFGKAAGLGGIELAKFSNDFTGLASDLASFNNTSPEEAVNAIGAALRGEAEPLRKFGVLLNDATLKTAALELGIYDGNGALTAQQKILAAQNVIYKQTTTAQGDFGRTSDGLANSQRILKAQLQNLQIEIGKGLLPVVQAILPPLKAFAAWAVENPKAFKIVAGTIAGIATAILAVNFAMAANPFTLIAVGIAALVTGLAIAYTKFEQFRNIVNTVLNGLIGGFEMFANAYIGAINIIIAGINLINPFTNIDKFAQFHWAVSAVAVAALQRHRVRLTVRLERQARLFQVCQRSLVAVQAAVAGGGTGGGGSRSGGGGGGGGIGGGDGLMTIQGALTTVGMAERIAAREQAAPVNIVVNGGISTSAEIGQSVYNALLQYKQVYGPLRGFE